MKMEDEELVEQENFGMFSKKKFGRHGVGAGVAKMASGEKALYQD